MVATTSVGIIRSGKERKLPKQPPKKDYPNPFDDPSLQIEVRGKSIRELAVLLNSIALSGDAQQHGISQVREDNVVLILNELKGRDTRELREDTVLGLMLTRLTNPFTSDRIRTAANELSGWMK